MLQRNGMLGKEEKPPKHTKVHTQNWSLYYLTSKFKNKSKTATNTSNIYWAPPKYLLNNHVSSK